MLAAGPPGYSPPVMNRQSAPALGRPNTQPATAGGPTGGFASTVPALSANPLSQSLGQQQQMAMLIKMLRGGR